MYIFVVFSIILRVLLSVGTLLTSIATVFCTRVDVCLTLMMNINNEFLGLS